MHKLLLFIFFTLIILSPAKSYAQYFETGQAPSYIEWRQINSDNFQVIYPSEYENKAQKLVNQLENIYEYSCDELNYHPKKISIVLHTHAIESNGLVTIAPNHSEFYPSSNQNTYGSSFINQLAIHEFRHVVQIDKMSKMIPRIVRVLFGEHANALYFGYSLPWWFIEGDAVVTETALSQTGRGRFPPFLMEQKAQVVEKGVFSYDKAYNRSYKDYVPNHYSMGYYIVGNTQKKWSNNIWNQVALEARKKKFSLTPFNSSLKSLTGFNKANLYQNIFEELKHQWIKEDSIYQSKNIEILTKQRKFYTNYLVHSWLTDTTIIIYKKSYNTIPSIIKYNLNTDKETIIHQPGIIFDKSIHFKGDHIIYSEMKQHVRWQHAGSSIIHQYDIKKKQFLKHNFENKLVSPAFSPNKMQFVVVETDKNIDNLLSIYDSKTCVKIASFKDENNCYFASPILINDHEIITAYTTGNGFKLALINLETKEKNDLINKEFYAIRDIILHNNALYFVADYNQKLALFNLNLESKLLKLVYEPRFGLENPTLTPNKKYISFSNYTADGYQLAKIKLDKNNWKEIDYSHKDKYVLADTLAAQQVKFSFDDSKNTIQYQSKPYKKINHLFNFHSWGPLDINTDDYEIQPGFSFLSQNLLNTSFLKIGYSYDNSNKSNDYYVDYTYKGWFPVISIKSKYSSRKGSYYSVEHTKNNQDEIVKSDTSKVNFNYNHFQTGLNINLPLNYSSGRVVRYFLPEIDYTFNKNSSNKNAPEYFTSSNVHTLAYRLLYTHQLRKSKTDMYPNFGYLLDFNFKHAPLGNIDIGNQWSIENITYLPGLKANHGIKIYAAYQKQDLESIYAFSNTIDYTHGLGNLDANHITNFALKYKFPFLYPDKSLGKFIYTRRVSAGLIYDFTNYNYNLYNQDGNTIGNQNDNLYAVAVELISDVNFFQFYAPAQLGFRSLYTPQNKKVYFNLILSIDFSSF